ncbi:MAG TPA: PAS domain-containing protein [Usitatibacter sp.]|nr:PAS domain-containing protein [Usitatibacter sp.]
MLSETAQSFDELTGRSVLDTLPVSTALLSATGEVEFVNEQMLRYFGKPFDELKGWRTSDAIHPDDLPTAIEKFNRSISTGEPFKNEQRQRRFDGVYRWFQTFGRPIRNADGSIARWNIVQLDIDERRRAEEALRESERNARLIVDSIPGLVAVFTPNGEVEALSPQVLQYYGKTFEQLKHWDIDDTVHPDDRGRVLETFSRAMKSGEPFHIEARARRFDGVYCWHQSRGIPLRDPKGQILRWYNLITDIDDRMRAEEELLRSEAFLAQGEAVSETGSFLWDLESNHIRWSQQLYRLFEWEPGSPVTLERIATLVHPEDHSDMREMAERAHAGLDSEYVHRLLMPNGSIKYFHFVAKSVRDRDGRLSYMGSVQDITRRRKAEENLDKVRSELAHASRAMSLGVLTASIAHEVNQPLTGIVANALTCLHILAAEQPNIEGARSTVERALRDANRASEVIQRLRMMFARKDPVTERVDLNDSAREVLALSSSGLRESSILVHTDFDPDLPDAVGDRVQLQQVMLNLILNAADAMKEIRDRPRDLLVGTAREGSHEVRLSVRDSGCGIDAENSAKLFDPFYTTKSDGMGVGLSISRSIIESHAGRIWAVSNAGPGATFTFTVPCARERSSQS